MCYYEEIYLGHWRKYEYSVCIHIYISGESWQHTPRGLTNQWPSIFRPKMGSPVRVMGRQQQTHAWIMMFFYIQPGPFFFLFFSSIYWIVFLVSLHYLYFLEQLNNFMYYASSRARVCGLFLYCLVSMSFNCLPSFSFSWLSSSASLLVLLLHSSLAPGVVPSPFYRCCCCCCCWQNPGDSTWHRPCSWWGCCWLPEYVWGCR